MYEWLYGYGRVCLWGMDYVDLNEFMACANLEGLETPIRRVYNIIIAIACTLWLIIFEELKPSER